ncbi:hypothetical protein RI367_000871 [Sorochytrium milnesiophthora]
MAVAPTFAAPSGAGLPNMACTDTAQCPTGYFCVDKDKTCVSFLEPGLSFGCMKDADCSTGHWCDDEFRVCRPATELNPHARPCSATSHPPCGLGGKCSNGFCKTDEHTLPPPRRTSERRVCDAFAGPSCPEGSYCFRSNCEDVGYPDIPQGLRQPCRFDNNVLLLNCTEGLYCAQDTGRCETVLPYP